MSGNIFATVQIAGNARFRDALQEAIELVARIGIDVEIKTGNGYSFRVTPATTIDESERFRDGHWNWGKHAATVRG